MSKQLTTIDFHGSKLVAIAGDRPETTMVAMKPVVEGMGLDWKTQHRKLSSHPVISKGMVIMTIPAEAKGIAVTAIPSQGGDQEMACLSLDLLNFWLATIHPDRIKDQNVRARVIEYQTECARVLFNHFFGKVIAAGSHLTAREAGGIAKGVVNKALTPISAKLDELMQKVDGVLAVRPIGVAVTTSRTAKGWLQHYGVTKRKRGLSHKVSCALKRLSIQMGFVISRTTEEGKLCFHEVVANAYFGVGAGRHLLPKAVKGQKEMGLESASSPFYENTSVSAVTASHPFGGGNAGVRMSNAEIEMYLLRARLSLPDENGCYQVPREGRKRNILNVGKAIAQLWHDLEEEERAGVGQKALA